MSILQEVLLGELSYDNNWKIIQEIPTTKDKFDLDNEVELIQSEFVQNIQENNKRVVCSNMQWMDFVSGKLGKPFQDCTEEEKEFYLEDFINEINGELLEQLQAELNSQMGNYGILDISEGEYEVVVDYGLTYIEHSKYGLVQAHMPDEDYSEEAMYLAGYVPTTLTRFDLTNTDNEYSRDRVFLDKNYNQTL